MRALVIALALLLLAAPAAADPDAQRGTAAARPWAIAARTSYAYMGHVERPTGGMQLTAEGTRAWPLGSSSAVSVGASLSMFGFDVGPRWLAILGGPMASIRTRTWGPISIGAAVHLDFGRLPTCSRWGFCMLSSGLFPLASAGFSYDPSERVSLAAHGGVRIVRTLPYSGGGLDAGIAGVLKF